MILLNAINAKLCVYNSQGILKYDNLNLTDIDTVYPELEYFIGNNPFNTYFGDCVNDQDVVNIYGIHAQKEHNRGIMRKFYDRFLKKSYFKEDCTRCNLLSGNEPESNPYNKELTGLINPNILDGWKIVGLGNITISRGNSLNISKSYSFDDTYSVSIQRSIFEKEPYILDKNNQYSENKDDNYSTIISKIIEESLINSVFNGNEETWDDDIVKNISIINEEYNKSKWDFVKNSNNLTCTNDETLDYINFINRHSSYYDDREFYIFHYDEYINSDNCYDWNGSSDDYYDRYSSSNYYSSSFSSDYSDTYITFGSDEIQYLGCIDHYDDSLGISKNRNNNFSYYSSKGTSDNFSIGYSERNNSSKDKTESLSVSEILAKIDLNANIISNSIDKIKSMNNTENKTKIKNIGSTKENIDLITTERNIKEKNLTEMLDKLKSNSINISYDFTLDNNEFKNNDTCEVIIYKKITKIVNVFSCIGIDFRNNYLQYVQSLGITDIDFQLLNEMNKNNDVVNEKNIKLDENSGYFHLHLKCSNNNEQEGKSYIPKENRFDQLNKYYNHGNGGMTLYYKAMPNYLELASSNGDDSIYKSIQTSPDNTTATILVNDKGNIKLSKGNKVYFNTETGKISEDAIFRISEKNHLEVYVKDKNIFGPDETSGEYASEFANVDYSIYPGLINSFPEIGKKYISHLKRDKIDIEALFEQKEEICKATLLSCNCQCYNNFDFISKENCLNRLKYREEKNNTVTTYDEIYKSMDRKTKKSYQSYRNTNRFCYKCITNNYYNYTNEDITYICNKDIQKEIKTLILNQYDKNDEKCDCKEYVKCKIVSNRRNRKEIKLDYKCDKYNNSSISSLCKKECSISHPVKEKRFISDFRVPEVVVWSSVRPEHQHLMVGWKDEDSLNAHSYLVLNTHSFNDSSSYDGMTLYDPNGIPIWKLDISHPEKNSQYLDRNGYYLPFKYGYPFKNENITKYIPKKYANKNYPYLTIPKNVEYKGNTLYFGSCDYHLKSPNANGKLEGLISENGRFRLILKEDGNLIFKDHHVTIWESKTSDLWQGKAPYKLVVGNDGVMRILNQHDTLILSTNNSPYKNYEKYENYRLEVLNAGTFRIVDGKGMEIWNMWNHAPYHEFNVYLEEETYPSCNHEVKH